MSKNIHYQSVVTSEVKISNLKVVKHILIRDKSDVGSTKHNKTFNVMAEKKGNCTPEDKIVTIPEERKNDIYPDARPWYKAYEWWIYFVIVTVVLALTIVVAVRKIDQANRILEKRRVKAALKVVTRHYKTPTYSLY